MKKHVQTHVSRSKVSAGDHYGTGIRAKLATLRDGYMPGYNPKESGKVGKPPKTLA